MQLSSNCHLRRVTKWRGNNAGGAALLLGTGAEQRDAFWSASSGAPALLRRRRQHLPVSRLVV